MKKFKFDIINVWSCILFWWLNDGKKFDYFGFQVKKNIVETKSIIKFDKFAILN